MPQLVLIWDSNPKSLRNTEILLTGCLNQRWLLKPQKGEISSLSLYILCVVIASYKIEYSYPKLALADGTSPYVRVCLLFHC